MISFAGVYVAAQSGGSVPVPDALYAVAASLFLPFVWKPMLSTHLDVLVAMARLGLSGHVFLTRAFDTAPVNVIASFEYSALVWAALLGFLVWSGVPPITCSGGGNHRPQRSLRG